VYRNSKKIFTSDANKGNQINYLKCFVATGDQADFEKAIKTVT
jgi:hypothetical protein